MSIAQRLPDFPIIVVATWNDIHMTLTGGELLWGTTQIKCH